MNTEEMNALIEIVKQIAGSECQRIMKTANVASNHFGTILSINADKTCNVLLAGGETPYTNLVNKTGETLDVGDVVLIEALNGNIGNGYIKLRQGKSDISGAPDTIAWSKVYDTPSTLGGYGIQDAKIENGTITLGLNSITPLTTATIPVQSVNGKTGAVVLSATDVEALPSTTKIPTKTSDLTNDSNFVVDANYVHTDNNFTTTLKNQITTTATNLSTHISNTSNPHNVTKAQVGLSNVDNVKQYSATNPPPYPVTSVNNKTGVIVLTADDVGAATKEYVDDKAGTFYVTLDVDTDPMTADHTNAEIKAAYDAGKTIYVKFGFVLIPVTLPLVSCTSSQAIFMGIGYSENQVVVMTVNCTNDVWTMTQQNVVPTTRKINNKSLSSDITLTADDVSALPLTGGTLTGDLKVGSSTIQTNGHITGTWLRTTANTHLGSTPSQIAVLNDGWVYHRTPAEILSDIGAMPNQVATATTLGGVKVGVGLAIDDNGVLSATGGGVADSVDWSNVQNKPTTIAGYGITDAVTSVNGKSGDVTIEANTVTYKINNPTVAVGNWVANTNTQAEEQERTDYPYMATISVTNPAVTSSDIARVMFNYSEQSSGNFATSCYTVTNGVIIEAKEKPTAAITLNYIYIERTVS